MKIGTTEMYDDYNKAIFESKTALINDLNSYNITRDYLTDKLVPYKHYIETFTNIDYNRIKVLDKVIPDKAIKSFTNSIGLDINILKSTINNIVNINKNINKINAELKFIEESKVAKDIFKEVIYRFNTKISDEIIYKGYIFRPGFGIGNTRIKKVRTDTRVKKRINWNESNKLRKEILSRGGLPYAVIKRDELGRALENNGGEMWFVYFNTDFDYLWHWGKKTATVTNRVYYKFRPTLYNNTSKNGKLGNANKLKQLVTIDSPLLNNFFINENWNP